MKTSRLLSSSSEDVLTKTNIFGLLVRLQKTSSGSLHDALRSRPIYSSWPYVFKMSSGRLQNVFKASSRRLAKTSSRHLQVVFKTFSRRLRNAFKMSCNKVFRTSSRRLTKMSSRRFEDVLSS